MRSPHISELLVFALACMLLGLSACSTSSRRPEDDGRTAADTSDRDTSDRDTSDRDTSDRESSDRESSDRDTADRDTADRDTADSGDGSPGPPSQTPPGGEFLEAELNTVGWDQISGSPVVLLRDLDSGQTLPIWIGMAEARAISLELHGVELQRPMTHDLMVDLLGNLGAVLEEVVVHDLREGTYYGLLKLRIDGQTEPRWIDTRPSDGLALALRTDAKIRIARKLIDELPDFRFQPPDSPEQVVRALGLTVVSLEEVWRREFGLPPARDGIVVIATSGEARRQGILRGDLILTINGEVPREPLDLLEAIAGTAAEDGLRITYWRDGEEHDVVLDVATPEPPKVENVA